MKNKAITIFLALTLTLLAGVGIFVALRSYQLKNESVSPVAPESKPKANADPPATYVCKKGTNEEFSISIIGTEVTSCNSQTGATYYQQCLAGTSTKNNLSTYTVKFRVESNEQVANKIPTSLTVNVATNWCTESCGQDPHPETSTLGKFVGGCWSNQKTETMTVEIGKEYTLSRASDVNKPCGSWQIDVTPMAGGQPCYASAGMAFVCSTGMACESKTETPKPPLACSALSFTISTNPPVPTATPTATPRLTATPTSTPTSCNSGCDDNSDCAAGLVCSSGSCRNPSCVSQTNCTCTTPTPTPTATPVNASCNNSCTYNSDCGSGLVCYNGACRNPNCTTMTNCACPAKTATPEPQLPNAGASLPTILGISAGVILLIASLALAL